MFSTNQNQPVWLTHECVFSTCGWIAQCAVPDTRGLSSYCETGFVHDIARRIQRCSSRRAAQCKHVQMDRSWPRMHSRAPATATTTHDYGTLIQASYTTRHGDSNGVPSLPAARSGHRCMCVALRAAESTTRVPATAPTTHSWRTKTTATRVVSHALSNGLSNGAAPAP